MPPGHKNGSPTFGRLAPASSHFPVVAMVVTVTQSHDKVQVVVKTRNRETHKNPDSGYKTANPGNQNPDRDLPQDISTAIRHMADKLRRTVWLVTVGTDGNYNLTCGAVLGNKVQAHRRGCRTELLVDSVVNNQPTYCTFVTLTRRYNKTPDGRLETWQHYKQHLAAYLRRLKRHGLVDYVWVKEAHYDGGCHAHLLLRWATECKTLRKQDKLRVRGKRKHVIKDNWDGHVDVQALDAQTLDRAATYIGKELDKYAHCEDALRRAKRLWTADGDAAKQAADCKRIWTLYYGSMTKQRLYGAARRTHADVGRTRQRITDGNCFAAVGGSGFATCRFAARQLPETLYDIGATIFQNGM